MARVSVSAGQCQEHVFWVSSDIVQIEDLKQHDEFLRQLFPLCLGAIQLLPAAEGAVPVHRGRQPRPAVPGVPSPSPQPSAR